MAEQEIDHAAGYHRRTVKAGQVIGHATYCQMDRKGRRYSMHQADR